jgi:hypothetical protein
MYAQAFWWPEKVLIHASARTAAGFYISAEPWLTMPSDVSNALLGSAVHEALLAFRSNVAVPDYRSLEWKALQRARLRAVGAGSERQFMKGSKFVGIGVVGQEFHFSPTRNGGSTGPDRGYRFLPGDIVKSPPTNEPEILAQKLVEAWARCV